MIIFCPKDDSPSFFLQILIIPGVSSKYYHIWTNVHLQKSTHAILLMSINPSSSLGLRTAKILLFATLAKRPNSQK
jgi:hypothetical protein